MTEPRAEAGHGAPENVSDEQTRRPEATRPACQSVPAQLARRRAASWRCEPLDCGRRDPWTHSDRPLTGRELESWGATVAHLRDHDLYGSWQLPASVTTAALARCPA